MSHSDRLGPPLILSILQLTKLWHKRWTRQTMPVVRLLLVCDTFFINVFWIAVYLAVRTVGSTSILSLRCQSTSNSPNLTTIQTLESSHHRSSGTTWTPNGSRLSGRWRRNIPFLAGWRKAWTNVLFSGGPCCVWYYYGYDAWQSNNQFFPYYFQALVLYISILIN